MADGIAKGVGEQLGSLGKQIVTEVAKTPAKIVGIDETVGQGTGGKGQKGQTAFKPQKTPFQENVDKISQLQQQDEVDKQKKLAQARRLLQQFIEPPKQREPTLAEKLEMEEMEKKKQEIEEERKKAQAQLWVGSSKRPRGDLYGRKAKQFGGEVGKNVKTG